MFLNDSPDVISQRATIPFSFPVKSSTSQDLFLKLTIPGNCSADTCSCSEDWINIEIDNIRWLDNEKYFTWTSERDGWLHLFKVSRDGNKVQTITNGDFDVVKINCIDPLGGYVYYIASPDNFTQRYLYRSRLDGTGKAERITPSEYSGQKCRHYLC